jgi:peptidyl-lysine (3S)-dioxygenase / protease
MSITHKDVLLQLIREYQSFHGDHVEYLSSPPTALEFSRIVSRNRPVVIRSTFNSYPSLTVDAISDWPALVKWQDPDYLDELMDVRMITVAETPDGYLPHQDEV